MSAYRIAFGTSGWRERMDSGFDDANVLRAAQGIGEYLRAENGTGTVVVGYDARKNSGHFAELVCGVMSSLGFGTKLTDRPTPTPVVSFTTMRGAVGGIAVTASHNPPIYNGIKFIASTGATPLKEVTDRISSYMPEGAVEPSACRADRIDPKQDYLAALSRRFDLSGVKGMRVVVDTLHGAGSGYLADLLGRHGAEVHELHKSYDPDFGGLSPNPSEDNVKELVAAVRDLGADIGIANDGDADRFAIVDGTGKYYTANESGLMMCDYLFGYRHEVGSVAKSIQTTAALDRLCAKYGVGFVEVQVGFKNIARELMNGAVFGIEGAAQGVAFGNWIPDKDGIAAGALMCEMIAKEGVPLQEIWKRVSHDFGYGQFLTVSMEKRAGMSNRLQELGGMQIGDSFAGMRITGRSFLDGVKLSLDDGAWVLVRESGTEALVRAYVEAKTDDEAHGLADAVRRFVES